MKKLIVITVAFAAVPALAHAEGISLAVGNAIFSALYSIGIPGAVANFIAVNSFAISAVGSSAGVSFK